MCILVSPAAQAILHRQFLLLITTFTFTGNTQSGLTPLNHEGIAFLEGYNKAFPPSTNGGPVSVSVGIFIETVAPILSSEMEFRVNMRWVLSWRDPRIRVNITQFQESEEHDESCEISDSPYILFTSYNLISSLFWIPDIYIVNAKYTGIKKFEDYKLTNLRLYEEHKVELTFILNATVACEMDFAYYPMDVQNCPMIIQSFSYDSKRLTLSWFSSKEFLVRPMRLIQFMVVSPPPHTFRRVVTSLEIGSNVSQLVATFKFERLVGSHLVQYWIPSSLIVVLSWFSFWLELDVTSSRGFLLISCTLSLQILLLGLKSEFPPVAYVKAVDVWNVGCLFFVFLALLEFALVKVVYSIMEEERRMNYEVQEIVQREDGNEGSFWMWQDLVKDSSSQPPVLYDDAEDDGELFQRYRKKRLGSVVLSGRSVATSDIPLMERKMGCGFINVPLVWERKGNKKVLWREIDRWSKKVFPLAFVGFITIYWGVVMVNRDGKSFQK